MGRRSHEVSAKKPVSGNHLCKSRRRDDDGIYYCIHPRAIRVRLQRLFQVAFRAVEIVRNLLIRVKRSKESQLAAGIEKG